MLDDLKFIHQRDKSDALGVAEKSWRQYLTDFKFDWQPSETINEVIIAGMGGSCHAGRAYGAIANLAVPISLVQNYDLPARVGKNTLLVSSSYSGNTEEAVSILKSAIELDAESRPMIIVIAAGGKLGDLAKKHQLPLIELPAGYQPRYTFGFQYRALMEVINKATLKTGEIAQLETAANWLKNCITDWLPTVPTAKNPAKQLALELMGKSVVVYSGPLLFPAAYKWKINFNENSKNIAWCNQFPEFNHNEMLGWTSHPVDKPYSIIELRRDLEHPRVQKRFEVTDKLLSGRMPAPEIVQIQGQDLLSQLIWTINFGDFVSLYLALLNGLDPTDIDLIEKFKVELG